MHRLRIVRAGLLDDRMLALASEASAEGHAFVDRLLDDWHRGENRFSAPGECLWLAWSGSRPVGTCGLSRDPFVDDARIGRLRRLYVTSGWRRRGLASWLTCAALAMARGSFDTVRLRTLSPQASAFYVAFGFSPIDDETATHRLGLERP